MTPEQHAASPLQPTPPTYTLTARWSNAEEPQPAVKNLLLLTHLERAAPRVKVTDRQPYGLAEGRVTACCARRLSVALRAPPAAPTYPR